MIKGSLEACQYKRLGHIRRWQIHSGNNHICFNGHCITGKNLSGAIFLVSVISLTTIFWLIFELPVLMKELHYNRFILLVGLLWLFYTYIYFFRSMCTDPGIIQRPSLLERTIMNQQFHFDQMTSDQLNKLRYDIQVNDAVIKCKYCITCQMIRSPRSSHCPICSNCVTILDHHCPFLSTCIGMRNYRFFIIFLTCLLQTDLFYFITTLIKILISSDHPTFLISIPTYFILIITGPGALYICNLLGYHCMISSRALTTREDDKNLYTNSNPFYAHRWYLNLARKLCTSLPPSAYGAHRLINQTEFRLIKETV
ncbi:unnamed protein product [Adineta ricciae]|uniref:Palmitoyltransferase n=1 Tax=Adineta ricciae TaxID=249248 RepID=A0A814IRT1_ADIRI|nr:unnamed protein product [Adineta ricciae]